MVFPSSKYYEPLYGRSLLDQKVTTGVPSMSSPFYIATLPDLPSPHGLSVRNLLNLVRHTNLCIHNSESYTFLELSLFSCILTFVYLLIVKSMRAFIHRCLLLLWSVKPFYPGMTRRNKLQYLIHIQDWVKAVVIRRSNTNPVFVLFYPEVLPSLCQESHRNYTSSYEFLVQ